MGVYQTIENRLKFYFRAVVTVWIVFFMMTSVVVILTMPENPAHSMMLTGDQVLSDVSLLQGTRTKPSSVLAPVLSDPCLSLLHSASAPQRTGAYAMNRSRSRSQSRAETTAALGLMLGVRFAIEPNNRHKAVELSALKPELFIQTLGSDSVEKQIPRTTLSITAYRQCKKEYALKALSDQ
ncbi:MAG: hypothetical protein JKY11_02780 [Alphaproteobacteria bacterium]|nr:hypothetical protein [Alphaproteobacteria bacterium]